MISIYYKKHDKLTRFDSASMSMKLWSCLIATLFDVSKPLLTENFKNIINRSPPSVKPSEFKFRKYIIVNSFADGETAFKIIKFRKYIIVERFADVETSFKLLDLGKTVRCPIISRAIDILTSNDHENLKSIKCMY